MKPPTTTRLLAPTVATGVLMASYLVLRPYGDADGATTAAAAQAFASPWWVASHLAGALSLASAGWLALEVSDLTHGRTARLARWAGFAGAALVLPYYGAETFALHAVGARAAAGDQTALVLVDEIRNSPVAMTTFGLGLVLLAVSGSAVAVACRRSGLLTPSWAAWPWAVGLALVLPQYSLPPAGRVAFGLAYAAAAAVLGVAVLRSRRALGHPTDAQLAARVEQAVA